MSEWLLYHNPRCSKSRQTLALLEENGQQPDIRLYLEDSPNADEINALLSKLGIGARALLRKGEQDYKDRGLSDTSLSDDVLVQAMVACPKLIERPIAIKGDKAVLGRPPENVLELLA